MMYKDKMSKRNDVLLKLQKNIKTKKNIGKKGGSFFKKYNKNPFSGFKSKKIHENIKPEYNENNRHVYVGFHKNTSNDIQLMVKQKSKRGWICNCDYANKHNGKENSFDCNCVYKDEIKNNDQIPFLPHDVMWNLSDYSNKIPGTFGGSIKEKIMKIDNLIQKGDIVIYSDKNKHYNAKVYDKTTDTSGNALYSLILLSNRESKNKSKNVKLINEPIHKLKTAKLELEFNPSKNQKSGFETNVKFTSLNENNTKIMNDCECKIVVDPHDNLGLLPLGCDCIPTKIRSFKIQK